MLAGRHGRGATAKAGRRRCGSPTGACCRPSSSWSPSACGPRHELARDAGLEVGRGILVDDGLETSGARRPRHRRMRRASRLAYGLVEPAYEQADVLARRLAGEDAHYAGSVPATSLKVSGVPVFSAGLVARRRRGGAAHPSRTRAAGTYRKLLVRGRPARRRAPRRRRRRGALVSRADPIGRACRLLPPASHVRASLRARRCDRARQEGGLTGSAMSERPCQISTPSRSAISKAWRRGSPRSATPAPALASGPAALPPEPTGPDAVHLKAQDKVTAGGGKLVEQEKWKRAEHPFDGYAPPRGGRLGGRGAEAGRQFPLALSRPVLCRADAELLHVPAAHPERHPQPLAVRRPAPTSPIATAAATAMSPPAPTCRSARSRRRARSPSSRACRISG